MSTKHRRPVRAPAGTPPIGRSVRLLLLRSLILLVAPRTALGQPATITDNGSYSNGSTSISPAIAVIIVAVIIGFFFLGIFAVYLSRCADWSSTVSPASGGGRRSSRRGGLDPKVLETFPKLPYTEAKGLQIGNGGLDCAVCLSEFKDDEMLRMLPKCCHVFHPHCIDAWLGAHVTCPVCRANLEDPNAVVPVSAAAAEAAASCTAPPVPADRPAAVEMVQAGEENGRSGGYGRSHSVGFAEGATETMDRFTLRLPEHVRKEITASGILRTEEITAARLRRAASVGDLGFAAVRGGVSGWGTFLRSFSWRRKGEGDATAESSSKRVHTPSGSPLNCFVGGGSGSGRENSEPEKDEKEPSPWV